MRIQKTTPFRQVFIIFLDLLIILVTTFIAWVVIALGLSFLFYRVLHWEKEPEGDFSAMLLIFGASTFLTPLGIVPAYFLSMKLAEYLRERRGWEIKHPRQLFAISLAIPTTLILATLSRSS